MDSQVPSSQSSYGGSSSRAGIFSVIGIVKQYVYVKDGVFETKEVNKNLARQITDCASVGKLIRAERKQQKLTQKQLAFACGTGLRVIGEIEEGKKTAQASNIFKIINLLRLEMFCLPK